MKRTWKAALLAGALALTLTVGASAASFTDTAGLQSWAQEAVDYVSANGIMNGTSATTFNPSDFTDRATVATIIWRLEGEPIGNITGTFSDVRLGQWYTDAVDWAAEEDIIAGSNGNFYPTRAVTRQDLAVMLYRYAGSPTADRSALTGFTDLDRAEEYALDALAWAVEQGILTGSDGMLMPANGATRVQVAAMFMRYIQASEPSRTAG